jgi:putative ABC transport system substrate-binding protein
MLRERVDGLLVVPSRLTNLSSSQIADFAAQHQLPLMGAWRLWASAGALLTYGPNVDDTVQHAATHVDKILKGAKPADLPVEQPMTFDFVVNMKTARELGITLSNEIMLQVTEVIDQ